MPHYYKTIKADRSFKERFAEIRKELIFCIVMILVLVAVTAAVMVHAMNGVDTVKSIRESGAAAQGTVSSVKGGYSLHYAVDGVEYDTDCKISKKAFKALDEDGDGQAGVEVHYDQETPERAVIEQSIDNPRSYLTRVLVGAVVMAVLILFLLRYLWKRWKETGVTYQRMDYHTGVNKAQEEAYQDGV